MALQMFLGFVFFNLDVVVVFDVFCNAMVEKTQRLRVVKLKRVGLCEEGCNIGTKKWGSFQKSHDSHYPIIFIYTPPEN